MHSVAVKMTSFFLRKKDAMTLWTTAKMTKASTTLTVTVMASVFGMDKNEADKNVDANIFFFKEFIYLLKKKRL